jgi:hypothetical protein
LTIGLEGLLVSGQRAGGADRARRDKLTFDVILASGMMRHSFQAVCPSRCRTNILFLVQQPMTDQLSAQEPGMLMALIQGTTAVPKSVAKLIDTIGEQIGLFAEPFHTRRMGKAEADVTVTAARAEAEIATIKLENRITLRNIRDREGQRVMAREARRQRNLEAIVVQAAKELPQSVSEQPVDQDWVAQFINHAQDVSDEQMRSLWARLLAGEVTEPGSFALQTISVVRVMMKRDADFFTRLCSMAWQSEHGWVLFIPEVRHITDLAGIQLAYMHIVHLETLGLVRYQSPGGFERSFEADPSLLWKYHQREHRLTSKDRQLMLGPLHLTPVGHELCPIAGASPNEEYRTWAVAALRSRGWQVQEADANSTSSQPV